MGEGGQDGEGRRKTSLPTIVVSGTERLTRYSGEYYGQVSDPEENHITRNFFDRLQRLSAAVIVVAVTFTSTYAHAVDLMANFRLFGEVQGFGLGGWGDMGIHFGVNGDIHEIGKLEKPVASAPFGSGVLAPLSFSPLGGPVDIAFSVPFTVQVGEPASMYIGLGDNGYGGFNGGSVQCVFDFSDNVYYNFPPTYIGATCDQGLTLQSVTLADGTPLADAGLKFEFVQGNTVLTAGASGSDSTGSPPTINTATPPNRAAVFVGGTATAKLAGAGDGFCGPAKAIVDLDASPEPDPFVFDLAFAVVSGANNILVSQISPPINSPPVVDAGPNITASSSNLCGTVLAATASDPDNDPMQYRWLEGQVELSPWLAVQSGQAPLDLCAVQLTVGAHTLAVEVSDGKLTSTDSTIVTISNSPPTAAPAGGGVYEAGIPVTLTAQVSDPDNDILKYSWGEGENVICAGTAQPPLDLPVGTPYSLPECKVGALSVGKHTLTLSVSDGINSPVTREVVVDAIDTTAPTLAPEVNTTILWPPNHRMVNIVITTHAQDKDGQPLLAASVASNEAIEGLGDGDMAPDWSQPVVDQTSGVITLQLRAERSGKGTGREYTVAVTATDTSGNTSTVPVRIVVPHDMRPTN